MPIPRKFIHDVLNNVVDRPTDQLKQKHKLLGGADNTHCAMLTMTMTRVGKCRKEAGEMKPVIVCLSVVYYKQSYKLRS